MAMITKANVAVEYSFRELDVIRRALQGARDNYYFETDEERDLVVSLLSDMGA
ncbi:hypothetical protein ACFYW9_19375 [Streptomyces sp. NPDC002698]|uniref:hypothetical protein n=1 Tax=Streptomyces sp. NPDC002698 TaxID=3364660 RepID=UPI003694A565